MLNKKEVKAKTGLLKPMMIIKC